MLKTGWVIPCLFIISLMQPALAQETIIINQTQPCFLNYTAGWEIIQNCNAADDPIRWVLSGWEWVTGGYFTMIMISVLIVIVYAKYREIVYPIYIGIAYLPISFALFPQQFVSWAIVMAFVGIGFAIWYAITQRLERG